MTSGMILCLLIGLLIGLIAGTVAAYLVLRRLFAERLLAAQQTQEHLRAYADPRALTQEFATAAKAATQDALNSANNQFLQLAEQRLSRESIVAGHEHSVREQSVAQVVQPLQDSLIQLRRALAESEEHRAQQDGQWAQQWQELRNQHLAVMAQTQKLASALQKPHVRGGWGEQQLRRVVEAAGMLPHVDFSEQYVVPGETALRPDMVVHLGQGKDIVVDAKAPLHAYLEALDATEPADQRELLQDHARYVRKHVQQISTKAYWSKLATTPEFVVLFLPADHLLSAALEADPLLLEHAFAANVVVATPSTFSALLRTVAYTWRTEAMTQNAAAILQVGRELVQRVETMHTHFAHLAKSLNMSVEHFNKAMSSYDSRVLTSARKLTAMQLSSNPLEHPEPLTTLAQVREN